MNDLNEEIKKSTEVTGALKDLKEAAEVEKDAKPIVEFKVNNPIARIVTWFRRLRKRQMTTFSMHLGIPLIALPIVIITLLAFIIALSSSTSKKQSSTIAPTSTPLALIELSKVGIFKVVKSDSRVDYFLVLDGGEAIKLKLPEGISLNEIINQKVIVVGKFDKEMNYLEVNNITLFEEPTPTPKPTIEPIPTLTPQPIQTSASNPY